jgi:hypothetical protein
MEELNFKKDEAIHHWVSFPLIDFPKRSLLLAVVVIIVALILWEIAMVKWEQPLYYVLGILVLLIGIMPYLVPTGYYLFETGFLVQYPILKVQKKYSEYGCFYADKLGVMLSTFKIPRRLDTFRGQSIRFSREAVEREAVLELLTEKIGKRY